MCYLIENVGAYLTFNKRNRVEQNGYEVNITVQRILFDPLMQEIHILWCVKRYQTRILSYMDSLRFSLLQHKTLLNIHSFSYSIACWPRTRYDDFLTFFCYIFRFNTLLLVIFFFPLPPAHPFNIFVYNMLIYTLTFLKVYIF